MSKLKINSHHAGTGELAFVLPGKGSDLSFAGIGPPFGRTGRKESKHRVRALEKLIAWLERGMQG